MSWTPQAIPWRACGWSATTSGIADPAVASKGGGEFDFNITQADTTWHVVVLDEIDGPISPETAVPFKLSESWRHILNWQRVD